MKDIFKAAQINRDELVEKLQYENEYGINTELEDMLYSYFCEQTDLEDDSAYMLTFVLGSISKICMESPLSDKELSSVIESMNPFCN